MARTNFERLHVYRLAEELADTLWNSVGTWERFARDTVGKQLVRAADSVGANIAEGTGRGSARDNRRFIRIARGSLDGTKHWLRRAYRRGLLNDDEVDALRALIDELAPRLNAYLKSVGKTLPANNNQPQRAQRASGQQQTKGAVQRPKAVPQ